MGQHWDFEPHEGRLRVIADGRAGEGRRRTGLKVCPYGGLPAGYSRSSLARRSRIIS